VLWATDAILKYVNVCTLVIAVATALFVLSCRRICF